LDDRRRIRLSYWMSRGGESEQIDLNPAILASDYRGYRVATCRWWDRCAARAA
jgi:hypothetical protein